MLKLGISFDVPEWSESSAVSERWHNRVVKAMVREELNKHLTVRIPSHFEYSAASRYRYTKRTEKYQRTKIKYRGRTVGRRNPVTFAPDAHLNLVKTGRTRAEIARGAKVSVGGSGSLIAGTLRMKVPIPGSTGRQASVADLVRMAASGKRRKITNRAQANEKLEIVRRTVNEIERFAQDEIEEINKAFATKYADALTKARRTKKKAPA